jgi:hypothetical protein
MKKEVKHKVSKKKLSKNERQLRLILIIMGVVILAIAAAYYIASSLNKFSYGGLNFEKINYDQLVLFHSKMPILNQQGGILAYYNIYLRTDPRKTNVPITGAIKLMSNVKVSLEPGTEDCSDNGIAGATLGTLFQAAGITPTSGTTDKAAADEKQTNYITCADSTNSTVIIIRKGNSTEINQESRNCYSINFKNCEIMVAVERFVVGSIANSKGITV